MFVTINNICKSFNNKTVVNDFNLNINKGELISILGPSGCGKTTTLKIIGGFHNPDKGSIVIDNIDITKTPANLRPTATVFQSYALFPNMNVIKNVIYGLKFKKIKKKEALQIGEEILNTVGLKEYKDFDVNKLSGGQQQRVALARALILNPKVLLLDEPLSNLDAKLRVKMREEIKEIQKKFNITMIFVTHDQEEAMSISDRIVIMNEGKIEQIGTPEEIYKKPSNTFVADFIGRINIMELNGKSKLIRPEELSIDRFKGEFHGEINNKQFKGAYTTYFVNSKFGTIEVDSNNEETYAVGDKVYLSVNRCLPLHGENEGLRESKMVAR